MQAEKQDELWKKAVEQMDHLPEGFSFNTGNTWRKLEHQLQRSTSPGIKTNQLYYAAACLVVAAIVSGIWISDTHETPVVNIPGKNKLPLITVVTNNPIATTTKDIAVVKKRTNNYTVLVKDSTAQKPVHANIDTIAIAPVIIQASASNDITTVSTPATATQQKNAATLKTKVMRKFTVVHINDLATNTPEIPTPTFKKVTQPQPEEIDNTIPPEAPKSWWLSKPKVVNTISLTENP